MKEKKSALVSIVMGTYKRSHIIGRTLKSLLGQSYSNIEVVIVDDNQPGETEEIAKTQKVIESFNDPRVKYVKNYVNLGHPANFRKCFDQVRGEYFMLYSDDDELLDGALEEMVVFLESNPTASLAHGYDIFKYPDGTIFEEPFKIDLTGPVDARLYFESQIRYDGKHSWSQSSVLYRTDFMKYHNVPVVDNYMWDAVFHAGYLLHSREVGHIRKHLCIRNEEYRHTGRHSEAFEFHAFIEVDYMMLRFVKQNEALLISKNYDVRKLKKVISWKLLKQFVHVRNFEHALFCLRTSLLELSSIYLSLILWLPVKLISVFFGKVSGLNHKIRRKGI